MLKDLKIHHREIGRLKFEGYKPNEIATRTSTKITTVYSILRDPMCKAYMNGLADKADKTVINVREKLAEMNSSALETIESMLSPVTTAPHSVQLNAAKDVLDRTGYKAPEEHRHLVGHFTAEDLKELKDRADAVDISYAN